MTAIAIGYFGNNGYTLQRGSEIVSCNDVVTMETDAAFLAECFDEWKQCALADEAGYEYFSA